MKKYVARNTDTGEVGETDSKSSIIRFIKDMIKYGSRAEDIVITADSKIISLTELEKHR